MLKSASLLTYALVSRLGSSMELSLASELVSPLDYV